MFKVGDLVESKYGRTPRLLGVIISIRPFEEHYKWGISWGVDRDTDIYWWSEDGLLLVESAGPNHWEELLCY